MYKKYCKKIIEPLLLENGYSRVSNVLFEKDLSTGMKIAIDIQKFRGKNFITINIAVIDTDSNEDGLIHNLLECRLGDFLTNRQYDIWWSVKKEDIDESFLQIENIIKDRLLPALRELEDTKFAEDFIRNIQLTYELE